MHNIPYTGYYYLVDAGYTNGQGFLAPYRGQRYHLSECHRKVFWIVEKMRWTILRSASYYPIRTQNRIITTCCLLHNFIR
ncbi:hypothetical protein ACSBR2_018050 [Camellia fascicularis]